MAEGAKAKLGVHSIATVSRRLAAFSVAHEAQCVENMKSRQRTTTLNGCCDSGCFGVKKTLGSRPRVALSSGWVTKSMQQMESEGKMAELTSGLRASMGKGTYGVEIIGNFNKNGDTPNFPSRGLLDWRAIRRC